MQLQQLEIYCVYYINDILTQKSFFFFFFFFIFIFIFYFFEKISYLSGVELVYFHELYIFFLLIFVGDYKELCF